MSSMRWIGRALPVQDVWKLVVGGTWLAAETATLTVNSRDLVLTVGATVTTAAIATALKELWNGDAITGDATRSETGDNVPEFAEATAAIGATASTVLFTVTDKGKPITISVSTTSGSGTLTLTNPTVGTGRTFWSNTDNWDGGALPADTDTVYLDHSDVGVFYGLAQSSIQPAAVYVDMSFTGGLGLPEVNEAGGYHEYLKTYLEIGPVILQVGAGAGNGSGRLKFNTGTDQCALTVLNTGSSADELPALLWKGTHASNTMTVYGGSAGVAIFGGEAATIATLTMRGGDVTLGAGCTLTDITVYDGTLRVNSAIGGTLTVYAGTVIIEGTGAVAGLVQYGGTVTYSTSGALGGSTTVSGDGVLDFSQDPRAKTITNPVDIYGRECRIIDSNKAVTGGSNLIVDCNQGADPSQISFGPNVRVTRGSVA